MTLLGWRLDCRLSEMGSIPIRDAVLALWSSGLRRMVVNHETGVQFPVEPLMIRTKKMPGLKELPKVEGDILAGITTELMDLDPLLRPVFHKGIGEKVRRCYQIRDEDRKIACGVYLKRRKVEMLHIAIYGNVVHAAYEWKEIYIPPRPVPNKPGWVYRGRRDEKRDDWKTDIQDPQQFRRFIERATDILKERIAYLEARRQKAATQREERKRNAEIAAEAHARWRERWERVQADMYVI